MIDIAFIDAQYKFYQRDPRALAEFVRAHDLTPEQREYVAQVLLGEVPQRDGRIKRQTEDMVSLYLSMKRHAARLFYEFTDADIYRMLDNHYKFNDGSARRIITRALKRKACTKKSRTQKKVVSSKS